MSATSPGRARLSRRHRRTLIAAGLSLLLVGVLVASALVRPKTDGYDPGATAAGIVSTLARPIPDDYPRVTFTDVTAEAGLSFRHFAGERSTQLPEDMGSGAAL
jgi:enediyne biosynthesis protein E4